MEKSSKVVIFGATGSIGAYAAIMLKEKGYNIVAVGHRTTDNGFFADYGIPYYSVDVTKSDMFSVLPQKDVTAVIHLAGIMPARMKGYDPHLFVSSVIEGTLNVLEYTRIVGAERIIFSHSRADSNYLMGKEPIPSDIVKKFPLKGDHSVYSICKNAAVDLIEHYYWQYGIRRFVLRLPTIYSYHPNPFFYVNGVRKMMGFRVLMEQAMRGDTIEIWGDPSKGKEIIGIHDTVQVIERSLESNLDGGVYNVGRGIPVTMEEQALGIIKVFCKPDAISKVIYRPDMPDAREYVNDISKTVNELGYQPQYDYIQQLEFYKKMMEEEPFSKLWGKRIDYK